ncbi:Argonaute [Ganoderma sinense ZZ0214-1]|uniref:Argonaute n=1 Tax=Ganoderma sinense ZZ0214-1 TaxID=1077348 RepID=A0A2G8RRA5_9APHY|nr:Argonaute [Ganoderma sinense ZZ0214-1]
MDLSREFRQTEVWTNHFPITRLPNKVFFHYDAVEPEFLAHGRNLEVIDQLWQDHATTFNPRPFYDGRKNMYSTRDIPPKDYPVSLGRRRDAPTHVVKVRRVGTIDSAAVTMLTKRRSPHDPYDMYAKALSVLQLLVRQAPSLRHGFRAHVKAFFVPQGDRDLGIGLIARRGFFQSIRPTPGRLLVNVDTACALVYRHGTNLIDVMAAWLQLKDIRSLQNLRPQQYAELRSFLKGAHFERKYNVTVHHAECVGVRLGRSAIIPAEFCEIVEGQLFKRKIPADVQKKFLSFATQRPEVRLNTIRKAVGGAPHEQQFDYANSDFMREVGMSVSTEPLLLPSQVIQPPCIRFQDSQRLEGAFVPSLGAWNVKDRRFWRPGSVLKIWAVINFDKAQEWELQSFLRTLITNLQSLVVQTVQPQIFSGNQGNPRHALEEAGRFMRAQCMGNEKPQLLLVFLPANAGDCRRYVKYWGDMVADISTQCVRGGKWNHARDKQLDQYCNNLALKINVRLEGVNSMIDSPFTRDLLYDSMVIGADVGHPGPGVATRPSMTGFVASVSPGAAFAVSYAGVQQPRVEMIQDLTTMVMHAIERWAAFRRMNMPDQKLLPPKNIFFYRDGTVNYDLEAFRKAGIPEIMQPKLLFVIVAKRHHVRFFPKSSQEADKSGNCPAGLLVDDHITNPNYQDFYLQSHSGLLGTSRPTHYVVLRNETGLGIKIATRAVSIPAPVYYADRICRRLAFHCENGDSFSDTASSITSSQTDFNLEEWKHQVGWKSQAKNNWRMNFL